jgi:phosphatidate cytidylyltransferase
LLFGCTFGGPISFGLFFAAVQAVMLKEFYRIMRASGYRPAFWIGIVVSVLIFACVFTSYFIAGGGFQFHNTFIARGGGYTIYPPIASPAANDLATLELPGALLMAAGSDLAWIVVAALLTIILLVREIVRWPNSSQPFADVAVTLLGLLYVSLPMSALVNVAYKTGAYDPRRVFLLIFLIWAADTGAYFAGKNFGRHKLAPSISPGKTWEGWAGGALLTLAVGWVAGYFVPDVPLGHRLVAAGVVAVFGPLGDLAESMLKRSAGVKDSGTFLPGHGGLLDRFDAFLLVLPVLALLQALAG